MPQSRIDTPPKVEEEEKPQEKEAPKSQQEVKPAEPVKKKEAEAEPKPKKDFDINSYLARNGLDVDDNGESAQAKKEEKQK